MKIFLSWSGARSRAIAEALNDWLKRVIQAVKPFYSPEIEKGAKWSSELDAALEGTRFGIICLTPDNLNSTWIHYEAGALSKTPDALIWTFLHGINAGDVPQPLGKYQHTVAVKEDVFRLVSSINKRLADVGGESIDATILAENFELYWPQLEEKLIQAEKAEAQDTSDGKLTTEEMLIEMLESIRYQQRAFPFIFDYIENVAKMASINKLSPFAPSLYFYNPYRDKAPLQLEPSSESDETDAPRES